MEGRRVLRDAAEFMDLKKIFCGLSAAVLALCSALPVMAEEEKEVEPWSISDESILTDDKSKPTFSFDSTGWKDYFHITPDGSDKGYSVNTEDIVSYQGLSLKISGSSDGATSGFQNFAWTATDADGNLQYPGSDAEDAEYVTYGVELDAADFGMNYFDGCTIKFTYRINPNIKKSLLSDSIFAFPADDDYKQVSSNMSQIAVNETDTPNTAQYQDKIIPVPTEVGATKFIFEIPLVKRVDKTDLIYIDNLYITTNDGRNVANIDGYNDKAEKKDSPSELQIAEKEEKAESTAETAADSKSVLPVVIGIVAGVLVIGGVAFFVIKKVKGRFY